ncbi:hypothetical protein [Phenylobacterium sp. SCN 70-31]|uniref:SecDF P1 head subdomain-containing protein n=1 Tax=Phenylobacterium sp. SCN 70-31 TaxID=1660129 RepID=UPI000868EE56|nr:hypothetical protein [Phenylobacterium sp. SCN 70-31]ODT89151.1 MAG: hypothetical protein ABS78_02855 [Phenylobacterium sp. SCN 70-31]
MRILTVASALVVLWSPANAADDSRFSLMPVLDANPSQALLPTVAVLMRAPDGAEIWVAKDALLTAHMMGPAKVIEDRQTGLPAIEIALTAEGQRRLTAFSRDHIGRRLAIMIEGRVEAAPLINEELATSSILLTTDSAVKAENLAGLINRLRSAPPPLRPGSR